MAQEISSSDFGQLRAFLAVAESLSFSRAAEVLGVSASALSQTVRGLEERLGVRLLNRTTRSVSLTEAGETLLRRVAPAVTEIGAALGEVRGLRERASGVVRLHSFRSAAQRYVRPILPAFLDAHPDIVVDITLDDAVVDVVAGGFDAAIRVGEVIERDMIAVKLGPEIRQLTVASPAYLARRGTPATPRDLHAHRCIGWRWPGRERPYKWEFCEDGRWFEIDVDGPVIVNSRDVAVQLAIDGVGIAFAAEDAVAEHVSSGALVPLLEAWAAPFPGLFVCYPAQRQMAPALRAFLDALVAGRGARPGPAPAGV